MIIMKKILTYIFIWTTIVGLSGCLDDDNNYNYSEVNELEKAGIGGMRNEYFLVYQQELTITPTFEFTIDKENPDVSYEWRLDGVLLPDETNPSCTFSFEEGGMHEVTYTVVDNKTGVKFSKSCTLKVRSPFARGWLVLVEDGQQSKLSFVGANSVSYRLIVTDGTTTAEIDRDSLVYSYVMEDVTPGLGANPKGLFQNAGYVSSNGETYEVPDEVIVMQNHWAELNGVTLEREVYTEDEFRNDLPVTGFNPVMAAMTFSGKAVLNSDGHIYWAGMTVPTDFHSCGYTSFPVGKDMKFRGVYPSYKMTENHIVMPVVTEDNELAGLFDDAGPEYNNPTIMKHSNNSGQVFSVQENENSNSPVDEQYKLPESWNVLTMMPATSEDDGIQSAYPSWVAIIKDGSEYKLLYFQWMTGVYSYYSKIGNSFFKVYNLEGLTGFTDIAVFNNKKYAVIANGNDLYYFQYGVGTGATLKKLHTFDSPVKSLDSNDIYSSTDGGSAAEKWQPEHNGQLGVALEDNTFCIYEVWETEDNEGVATDVKINQLFPDPANPVNNNFGKIVDVLYKYGSAREFLEFTY